MSDINNSKKPATDGRTIIAVLISVVIITAGVVINDKFFPARPPEQAPAAASQAQAAAPSSAAPSPAASAIRAAGGETSTALVSTPPPATASTKSSAQAATPAPVEAPAKNYSISTDLFEAVFTNKGGNLVSLKLRKHQDSAEAVNLILAGQANAEALTVSFGGSASPSLSDIMNVRLLDATTIEFSRTYLADVPGKAAPVPFTFRKVFTFHNGEYLFGLAVSLENSVNEYLPLDQNGTAYTLSFAPQIGPYFHPQAKNADFRKIIVHTDGKKKEEKPKTTPWTIKGTPTWLGLSGKYFVFLEVPEIQNYTATLSSANTPEFGQKTRIDLSRPTIRTSKQVDTFYFYFGPKTGAELSRYNYSDRNSFQKADLHLDDSVENSGILNWLEVALKFALNLFYKVIPNYGIAIILVTLLVKVILFPLTKKGSIASAQMAEVQPQIQAIQAKHKGNPEKLNKEMAEFYKTSGMNPMSGCLPLLIQFPIFIAMYNLFNTHFDLRGALFIPGWIPDLSAPETIWNFAPFKLPFLAWSDLRLLPIIYLVSQLVYGKFTQQPTGGQSANQMKIMMFGMPIVFFFILYDVPSGLLVYWIASNLLTIVQQVVINDILKKRKHAKAGNKIAPSGPKGR